MQNHKTISVFVFFLINIFLTTMKKKTYCRASQVSKLRTQIPFIYSCQFCFRPRNFKPNLHENGSQHSQKLFENENKKEKDGLISNPDTVGQKLHPWTRGTAGGLVEILYTNGWGQTPGPEFDVCAIIAIPYLIEWNNLTRGSYRCWQVKLPRDGARVTEGRIKHREQYIAIWYQML